MNPMSPPGHPPVGAAPPASAAYSSSDAVAQEMHALQQELGRQADELERESEAVADSMDHTLKGAAAQEAAALAHVQESEQAVVNALRHMVAMPNEATHAVQSAVAADLKSIDEAERSVANSLGSAASAPPTGAKP